MVPYIRKSDLYYEPNFTIKWIIKDNNLGVLDLCISQLNYKFKHMVIIYFFIAGMGQAHEASSSVYCMAMVNTAPGINPIIKSYSHCINHKL